MNPRDIQTNETMRCHGCGSRFHLYRSVKCPKNASALMAEEEERVPSYEDDKETLNVEHIFASEQDYQIENDLSYGYGVLDSAATKTVCGKPWFEQFQRYLNTVDKKIRINESHVWYRFGDDGRKKALFQATIPVSIFGKNYNLIVDVIDSNCPLLMGRPSLEKLGLILDFQNSTAMVCEQKYVLKRSKKGHFLASLMFSSKDKAQSKDSSIEKIISKEDMEADIHFTEIPIQTANEINSMEAEIFAVCEFVHSVVDGLNGDYDKTARKLHLVLGHPTVERMRKSIESWLHGQDSQKVKMLMSAIVKYTATCETCNQVKKHKPAPKVCLPLASKFNEVLAFDLTYWNDPVTNQTSIILHDVDLASRLSAARILKSKDPKHVLDHLVDSWFSVFGGPRSVYTDNGGEFANPDLVELIENLGITFKATAAQASFSNGINERHNAILKDILTKIRMDKEHQSTPIHVLLSYATFAKNCLVDHLGFSPFQRVFGRNPNIPNINTNNVCHTNTDYQSDHVREHLNLLHKSRVAFMKAENSDRIKRALNSRIYASDGPFFYGEKVFYWKESANKSARGWKGPGTVVGTEGKVIIIRHGSYINRSHETKVRRATEGESLSTKEVRDSEESSDGKFIIMSKAAPDENNTTANKQATYSILVMNNKELTQNDQNDKELTQNDQTEADATENVTQSNEPIEVSAPRIVEGGVETTIEPKNVESGRSLRPRENLKRPARYGDDEAHKVMDEDEDDEAHQVIIDDNKQKAMEKELESWKTHGVYREVDRVEAVNQIITTRWIFTDKTDENNAPFTKARLVVRGFQDKDKDTVLSESPTAHTESFKVMLAVMPTLGYKPRKMDISTAFLQGKELTRPVYIEPPPEANVDPSKCWLLLKGVYGLSEASRMWYERVHEVMMIAKYKRSAVDPALYFKYDENLFVLCVFLCHVDDFLYGGIDSEVTKLEQLIGRHFQIREIETGSFMYCGFRVIIEDSDDGFEITYSQPGKIPAIKEIKLEKGDQSAPATRQEERQFRGVLGALQWHANSTRPDLSFGVSKLLGETKSLEVKQCVLANKLLRKAKSADPGLIRCKRLVGDLTLKVFTDASFANLRDMGSQRGCIGFLMDSEEKMNLLEYKSNKIKKVCRSTFAAELLACNAAVDHTLSYRSVLQAFGLKISDVYVCTDNNGLRDNLHSVVSHCEEKNLRIELSYLRETLSMEGIKIKWVSKHEQLADLLTKERPGLDILRMLSS